MKRCTGKTLAVGNFIVGIALGVWLSAPAAYSGTLTIAATPGVVEAVETVAQAFEAAHPNDRVQIAIASEDELKTSARRVPVQIIVSDNLSFSEWLEARDVATRTNAGPAVHVPLAVVAAASRGGDIGSMRDLHNRLQHRDMKIAIPDPARTDCGRRAEALLRSFGVTTGPSERVVPVKQSAQVIELVRSGQAQLGIVFAPEAMAAHSVTIHAVSAPHAGSPVHTFAVKRGHEDHPVAKRFVDFVNSPEAQQVLRTRGYEVLQADQAKESQAVVATRTSGTGG